MRCTFPWYHPEPRRNVHGTWHRQSSGPAVKSSTQSFPLLSTAITRASVMEVQPDIQQRSGLDHASSLGASRRIICLHTRMVRQLQPTSLAAVLATTRHKRAGEESLNGALINKARVPIRNNRRIPESLALRVYASPPQTPISASVTPPRTNTLHCPVSLCTALRPNAPSPLDTYSRRALRT
jgi:hypothetical protein